MTKYFTNNFSITNLYKSPSIKSEIVTQMIFGDSFSISKRSGKWLKIKIKEDGYKGYIKKRKFSEFSRPTHKVCVLRSKVYSNSNKRSKINISTCKISHTTKVSYIRYTTTIINSNLVSMIPTY